MAAPGLRSQATPISLRLKYNYDPRLLIIMIKKNNNNNNIVLYIQITRLFMLVYKLWKLHELPNPAK